MRVYIPSRGRGDDRVSRGPAAQMQGLQLPYYVVSRSEAAGYIESLSYYGIPARVLVCPVEGIAQKRLWIAMHAKRAGNVNFCMIDDDVGFLVRKSPETWQLRGAEPPDVSYMLEWIEQSLTYHPHVSISSREGNNRAGVGTIESLVKLNTRPQRVLAYRVSDYLACKHLRVSFMEDFDVALQLLKRGGSNAVSYWWAQGQRKTNEDGGCSIYRTQDSHDEAARTLAALHPEVVQLVTKQNITDRDGFGTRTEVVVQWKQAYALGQMFLSEKGKSAHAADSI